MARLAPHWGTQAATWDELGADVTGQWSRHLVISVVTELIRAGVIAPVSRDALAHLARDWDAQAAQLERGHAITGMDWMRAKELRSCAGQLRSLLAIPAGSEQEGST